MYKPAECGQLHTAFARRNTAFDHSSFLASLGLMVALSLLGLLNPITRNVELDDHAVMDQPIDRRRSRHRVLEDRHPARGGSVGWMGGTLATTRRPDRSRAHRCLSPLNQPHDPHLRSRTRPAIRRRSVFTELAFEVRAGERIGLVGPNGAGKTTLMKILAGLESARLRHALRPARDPGQPAAAGARLRARRDADRGRQVGAGLADRPAARARRGRPGDGRGRRRGRPRAGQPALRRAPRPDRAPGRLLDRSPRRRGADRASVSSSRISPRRPRRSPAASSRG